LPNKHEHFQNFLRKLWPVETVQALNTTPSLEIVEWLTL